MDRQKILVVDDEPQNLQLLRQILKDDYELCFARRGEDALSIAIEQQPHLILLDVMMPGMDGHQVCGRLKADHRCSHIPVVFVTAMSDDEDETKGFKLGAVDYMTKPVRPAVVRARVRTHLELSDRHRACRTQVILAHGELLDSRRRSLQMLGKAAEYKDNETGLHVKRISRYSTLLAKAYGWNPGACALMLEASAMHDVGKVAIPDSILLKAGPLSAEERRIIEKHPEIGAAIIDEAADDSDLFRLAREIALTHHEKWNGKGYPKGLAGDLIPTSGRIVAIVDVFDALTSKRPYKKAWTVEEA